MTMIFPALFIGGPPHSGKSTLLYRLSKALRKLQVEHYALRASPDGEGDWTHEAHDAVVHELRMRSKDQWTTEFAAQISGAIDDRYLPLLVDVGGKVTPETKQVAAACTHALLLAAPTGDLAPWRELLDQLGRPIIAEVRSELQGAQQVRFADGVLHGTLTGLARDYASDGPCFTALVELIRQLFAYPPDHLYAIHRSLVDVERVLHLEQAIPPLPAHTGGTQWAPHELPQLLASLPTEASLAIYGRGPMWLYAALAAYTQPAPALFNARSGWMTPPTLCNAEAADATRLRWDSIRREQDHTWLSFSIPSGVIDSAKVADLPVPSVDEAQGMVLDGKLPNWLFAALVRHYRKAAWVAIYQPTLHGVVVVASRTAHVAVGMLHTPTRG